MLLTFGPLSTSILAQHIKDYYFLMLFYLSFWSFLFIIWFYWNSLTNTLSGFFSLIIFFIILYYYFFFFLWLDWHWITITLSQDAINISLIHFISLLMISSIFLSFTSYIFLFKLFIIFYYYYIYILELIFLLFDLYLVFFNLFMIFFLVNYFLSYKT